MASLPVCESAEEKEALLRVINYVVSTSGNCLHPDLHVTILNMHVYMCVETTEWLHNLWPFEWYSALQLVMCMCV
jgi:hypothetical protein